MTRLLIFELETLYKIFFAYVGLLLIIPNQSVNKRFSKSIGNLLYLSFVLSIVCYSFYVCYVQKIGASKELAFQQYSRTLSELIGYIVFILIQATYFLKHKSWKRLHKNLDILNNSSTNYEKWNLNGGKLIVIFLILHSYFCFLIYLIFYELYKKVKSTFLVILIIYVSWIQFYYVVTLTILMLILLFGIRVMLIRARIDLKNHLSNIKRSKATFLKVQTTSKEFGNLFGLQLLGIFAQCVLKLIGLYLSLVLMLNREYVDVELSTSWQMLIYLGSILIFPWFGPCAIAITCDMVTAETEKLLTSCYELQEKLDCRSYEYQELQSFASYIASNKIRFTAADFFEIKRSTLLSVIATSTTYFVALVQFY